MDPGDVNWRRIVASGALWAVVYNLIWGIAWFAFMRREWLDAVVERGQPLPWTAEVWFIWVTLTVPLGIQESLPTPVLALDALVNLVALVAAALIAAWSLGPVPST